VAINQADDQTRREISTPTRSKKTAGRIPHACVTQQEEHNRNNEREQAGPSSLAALGDGGAPARVGVGLGARLAVVVGRAGQARDHGTESRISAL
jgi:hypothetical protein